MKKPKVYLVTQGPTQRLVQSTSTKGVINHLAADVRIEEVDAVTAAELGQTLKLEKAAA